MNHDSRLNKQFLGCDFWFEIYLQKSTLDNVAWDLTLKSILQHIGPMNKLKVIMHIDHNLVRYYMGSTKDLTNLSNNLVNVMLRPINGHDIPLPEAKQSEWFIDVIEHGNVLDIRERYQIKRKKTLNWAVFSLRGGIANITYFSADLLFKRPDGVHAIASKRAFTSPGHLIAINFRDNEKYVFKKHSSHLNIQSTLHILDTYSPQSLFEVETFPYLPQNAYLSLSNYDFDRHSLIIGSSGSGKSKFISLFVDRLLSSPIAKNYRIIVLDPHASLEHDIGHKESTNVIRFRGNDDSTELFSGNNTDTAAATELTNTLFASLLGSEYSSDTERVLRFSMMALMTAQAMTLANLHQFLTDTTFRSHVLHHVKGYVPANVSRFFETRFLEIEQNEHRITLAPIIELLDEVQMRSGALSQHSHASSLAKVIESNRLTLFSLNKIGMGEKTIKAVAGLLIQQIFLLAQSRTFNEKIILIIDEVSVIQNPTIAQILAEARKYNLFVFLSQQYFGQIEKPLQDAIFSNVINYYVFKVSETDARTLEGNITMNLPKKMTMEATRVMTKEEDLRVPLLTEQDPRQCVVRVSSNGKILPAVKAKTLPYNS